MSRRTERLEEDLGGRYELGRVLGRGGMGEVWAAYDPEVDRHLAIKILGAELSGDAEFFERFRREGRTLAKFRHAGIVTIHETGKLASDGRLYMVMDLVPGQTLRDILDELEDEERVLDFRTAALYTVQIVGALKAAHTIGIIHRDVKPENVMVSDAGRITLLDFGVAKTAEVTGRRERGKRWAGPRGTPGTAAEGTKRSLLLGTPRYMAPETIAHGRLDPRSDLYSVGVVLVRMLTGQDAYDVPPSDERAMLRAHVEQAPKLRREKNPKCPDELWAIVLRLLEKDPDRRFQSAQELDAALSPFVRVSAEPGHPLVETMASERKERVLNAACERHVARAKRPRHSSALPGEGGTPAEGPDRTVRLEADFVPTPPSADVTRPLAPVPARIPEIDVNTLRARPACAVERDVTGPVHVERSRRSVGAPFPLARPAAAAAVDAATPPSVWRPPAMRLAARKAMRLGFALGVLGALGAAVVLSLLVAILPTTPALEHPAGAVTAKGSIAAPAVSATAASATAAVSATAAASVTPTSVTPTSATAASTTARVVRSVKPAVRATEPVLPPLPF